MNFNSRKVSERSWVLCGSPSSKDAAAGSVEAFIAEFGHFSSACFGRSRPAVDGASRKDPPFPAVPGGRRSGQSDRGGWAESAGSSFAVQANSEAVPLGLTLTHTQMVVVCSGSHPQTVNSK